MTRPNAKPSRMWANCSKARLRSTAPDQRHAGQDEAGAEPRCQDVYASRLEAVRAERGRWLHSLVTRGIASTGSRKPSGRLSMPHMFRKFRCSTLPVVTIATHIVLVESVVPSVLSRPRNLLASSHVVALVQYGAGRVRRARPNLRHFETSCEPLRSHCQASSARGDPLSWSRRARQLGMTPSISLTKRSPWPRSR